MVTTTEFTKSTEQHELTLDELDQVSGGNPFGFFAAYLATKVLDHFSDGNNGTFDGLMDITSGKKTFVPGKGWI